MDTHDKYTENNPTIWNFLSRKFSYPVKILYYSILQTTKEYKIIHRRTVNQSQASNFARSRNPDSNRETMLFVLQTKNIFLRPTLLRPRNIRARHLNSALIRLRLTGVMPK